MEELIEFCMFTAVAFGLLTVLINITNKPPKE
jgi:hypothetical protein